MNGALVRVAEQVCEKALREIDDLCVHVGDVGALELQAFMRMLDQTDVGYRE